MNKANRLSVVGIGYRPLGRRARELVRAADVILASSRLFEVFKRYDEYEAVKDRIKVINKVPDTVEFIRERLSQPETQPVVLLASGDPLFFGIGRRIREEFGREAVEVLPDLSSVQEAFARINEAWDDAFFMSLHGGPDIAKRRTLPYEAKDIPRLLERTGKMGILTDRENNPGVIAKALLTHPRPNPPYINSPHPFASPLEGEGQSERGLHDWEGKILMYVCERLGYPDEKITTGTPAEIAAASFSDPNVVIVIRKESGARSQESEISFGLREDDIAHERGLITKDEVRAVTIHKLRLPQQGVLWDVGAGSGSVSLEAAGLCPGLSIFAIEKDESRVNMVRENALRRQAGNVRIVHGSAPESLRKLPDPDRVFIGGSGGNLGDIIGLVNEKMPAGIVVINAASLDTLHDALAAFDQNGFSAEVSEISVSRSKIVAGKRLMSALNPVFIVTGEKG